MSNSMLSPHSIFHIIILSKLIIPFSGQKYEHYKAPNIRSDCSRSIPLSIFYNEKLKSHYMEDVLKTVHKNNFLNRGF